MTANPKYFRIPNELGIIGVDFLFLSCNNADSTRGQTLLTQGDGTMTIEDREKEIADLQAKIARQDKRKRQNSRDQLSKLIAEREELDELILTLEKELGSDV